MNTTNTTKEGPFTDISNARVRQHAIKHAHYLGTHRGKRVYRFPVTVSLGDSRMSSTWLTPNTLSFTVVGHSAGEVANFVREDWVCRPETEIRVYGPKGGHCDRYIGWESAIYHQIIRSAATGKDGNMLAMEAGSK